MPTCPNGHEVDAHVAFCRQCGASLAPLAQAEDAAARTTVIPPHPPVTAAPEQPAAPTSNTAVYVLAGVIALIGLVGIGIALLLGSDGDNTGRPTPTAPSLQTPTTGTAPTPSQHASATPTSATPPTGGTICPGTGPGDSTVGTIGSETSCGFAQAVDAAYRDAAGLNAPDGQTTKVSATSPTTGKTYHNIVCTSGKPWVTCVGGNHNTAHLFFSHP